MTWWAHSCQHVFAYAQLLDFWPSIRAWADVNFLGHILVCLLPLAQALVLHGVSTKKLFLASHMKDTVFQPPLGLAPTYLHERTLFPPI